MEEHNYPLFVRQFVQEYGGIKFQKQFSKLEKDKINVIEFNPLIAGGYDGVLQGYAEDLGRALYPIGIYEPEGDDIAVDDNGYVYLVGEYCLCAGSNLFKGIESIIRVDQRNMLAIDESIEDEIVWTEYKDGQNFPVDLETHEFKYDF